MTRAGQSARRQPVQHQPAIRPEFVTRKTAAALLQCSDQLISKFIKAGQLRAYKLGTHAVRIRRTDLEGLMEQWSTPDPTEVRQ